MRISISGHREIENPNIIYEAIDKVLSINNVTEMLFGGARGADNYALSAALANVKKPKLTVVVPDTVDKQPAECQHNIRLADNLVELKNPIVWPYESYKIRNCYLVENCDFLLAFFNGKQAGGTWQAIKYAKSVNKYVKQIKV